MGVLEKSFLKSTGYATLAQVVSLIASISLSLILPKFASIEIYGYWQLFLLYSSYIGILHFGFNDGVYLKLGGDTYESIDKKEYLPQFVIIIAIQFLCAILLSIVSYIFVEDTTKQSILFLLSIYIVIENCYKILGFTLMATNEINYYSKTVMIDKGLLIILISCVLLNIIPLSTVTIIVCFIVAHLVALLLLLWKFKTFFSGWTDISYKNVFFNLFKNMYFGIILTLSNILGAFIIGSGRLLVEHYWDIEKFAKISFSLSISMFLLVFISQIGLVLFPLLRNIDHSKQKIFFDKAVFLIGIFVFFCYIIFFPIYYFIKLWLPEYEDSLIYLVFLFPISLYEIRFNLIYTTYLKTLNKPRILLKINIITVVAALLLYLFSIYIKNIEMIAVTMLLAIMLRSILAQLYLLRYFKGSIKSYYYVEVLLSIGFILSYKIFNIPGQLTFYIGAIILIFISFRKILYQEFIFIKKRFN